MSLIGIPVLLSADILYLLARMGHGDDLAIVDANHPAEAIAKRTVGGVLLRCPGVAVDLMLAAVLQVFPLDSSEPQPARLMSPADPTMMPAAIADILRVLQDTGVETPPLLERFGFYAAAREAFGVIQCGDPRPYGNVLLRKGAIAGPKP